MTLSTSPFALASALFVCVALLSACDVDQPDTSLELDAEEIAEIESIILAQGNDPYPEVPSTADELVSLEDEHETTSFPTLSECFTSYCMQDHGLAYDNQCGIGPHPFGMPGVCILLPEVDLLLPGCGAYAYSAEHCNILGNI